MTRWRLAAAVAALAFAGAAVVYGVPDLSPVRAGVVPTTRPVIGDVDVRIHTLGELGPRQSMSLAAPSIGGMLQINPFFVPAAEFLEELRSRNRFA